MWTRSFLRSTTLRTASVVSSMLLAAAVPTAAAHAQSLPTVDALPSGGVDLTTGPNGIQVGVDTGDTGGVTVGAGQGGVNLDLRTTPKSTAPPAQQEPGRRVSTPGGPTDSPRSGSSPGEATLGASRPGQRTVVTGAEPRADRGAAGGDRSGRSGDRSRDGSGGPSRVEDLQTTARAERDSRSGIAPVFDLVERIPAVVRAGLVALALIAIALWGLWVRGRRRLDQNAFVDPDTGVANMEAFEQMLEREWGRAVRYRRPLGLLLLDVEQRGGGIRLLGERDACAAVDDISNEVRQSDTVARLSQSRFAVICPEAPQGSIETLAHALELRLEERRLRCWAGFAERADDNGSPTDLITRAATVLADAHADLPVEPEALREEETGAFPVASSRAAA